MYCRNCGKNIDVSTMYCTNCGTRFDNTTTDDNSSFVFAILGFFIPIIGLIIFLIYEGKKPKRAKSAGKGALIGFITKIVLSVFLVILYVVFATSLISNISNDIDSNTPAISNAFKGVTTDEILKEYVDISFGEFQVSNSGYYPDTSLAITVKNKAKKQYTYCITIEAVNENGARIKTDMIYADRLGAEQEIYLTAFKFVESDKISQFKNAAFRVLEINKYD